MVDVLKDDCAPACEPKMSAASSNAIANEATIAIFMHT